MQAKTSFFNLGLLRNDIKRFNWLSIAFLFLLLLSLPLKIVMLYSNDFFTAYSDDIWRQARTLFDFTNSPLMLLVLMVMPVLAGCIIFNYIHNDRSVDSLHALPINRGTAYNTHVLFGLLALLLPLILNAVATLLIGHMLGIELLTWERVICFTLVSMLLVAFNFILTVAVGMGTGSSILQAVFAYISMFLPFALFALLIGNAGLFLIGLDADRYIDSAQFLLPIVHMLNYFSAPLSSGQILSYVLLIAIIYLLGLWMYKARRLEVAGSAVSFDWLKPIFVFGLMLSLSAVLGMYFCMTQNQSRAWLYFGYILGALVGFVIARIMVKKTAKIYDCDSLKQLGIFSVILLVLVLIVRFDLIGYTQHLPAEAKIKNVYVDSSFYPLTKAEKRSKPQVERYNISYPDMQLPIYSSAADIRQVYNLHQKILDSIKDGSYTSSKEASRSYYRNTAENISIRYELEDGSYLYRTYQAVDWEILRPEIDKLYQTDIYKASHKPLWLTEADRIKTVNLRPIYGYQETYISVTIADPEQIKSLLAAIKKDIAASTFIDGYRDWYLYGVEINLGIKEEELKPIAEIYQFLSFRNYHFVNWLQQQGLYEQLAILPAEVDTLVVFRDINNEVADFWANSNMKSGEDSLNQHLANKVAAQPHIKIADVQDKNMVLQNVWGIWLQEPGGDKDFYSVYIRYASGDEAVYSLPRELAPDFVEQQL